jgi:bifunctional ADP-heptose synthase (sugar kinase/adenylyltransferase)
MLDRYWFGDVNRISPEAPVPVVKVERIEERPGGAANVARNRRARRGASRCCPSSARTRRARRLEAPACRQRASTPRLHRDPELSTTVKLRVVGRSSSCCASTSSGPRAGGAGGQARRVRAAAWTTRRRDPLRLRQGRPVHIAHDRTGPRAPASPCWSTRRADYARYRRRHRVSRPTAPNSARWPAAGRTRRTSVPRRAAFAKLGLDALLVTRSEEGMSALHGGRAALHEPTRAREVFDVSGAGDTVIATLALMLAAGRAFPPRCAWPTTPPASWSASWARR